MTDFALQRLNMVESQLRPSDITDRRILRAMAEIDREAFVPIHVRPLSYMDEDIRLGAREGVRTMMAPRTLARLIQLADIEPAETVLEIGAATGYATAVLARLAGHVVGLEAEAVLAQAASVALTAAAVGNAHVVTGDLSNGHPDGAPYDVIFINGAVSRFPSTLLDQLKDGGRLVAVLADGGIERATVWRRTGMHYDRRTMFDARASSLPGFQDEPAFAL